MYILRNHHTNFMNIYVTYFICLRRVGTVLTKPCIFELRMLYYNTLLLHKIKKIKMAGTSHEITTAMDKNHDEY